MRSDSRRCLAFLSAIAVAACGAAASAPAAQNKSEVSKSVVKIYSTIQKRNYAMPWQSYHPLQASGSGFFVGKKRILTNAHIISDARFLRVQKEGDDVYHNATVAYVGHDCDLAILTVEDDSVFEDIRPLQFSETLPSINDEVSVYGYPLGGTRISVTRGVVSRIDYSLYSHSGVDSHLVLQVDAAINPGNSGGPVLYNGKLVGVAFQGISDAENIGYAIPIPVVRRFLADVADGKYDGYPELGVRPMLMQNDAMRNLLGLPDDLSGVAVSYLDPFGAGTGVLRTGDVLLSIDGHGIRNDGTVMLAGTPTDFHELLERKQRGDSVEFSVWRGGKQEKIAVPLLNRYDPFSNRNIYDEDPRYFILGGLVFSPLTTDYLRTLGNEAGTISGQQLLYYSQYAKPDGLYTNRDEFVVLASRLPHRVNTYLHSFVRGVVSSVNGASVRNLADIKAAAGKPEGGFHVIRFDGMDRPLVMDVGAVRAADPEILQTYGIRSREQLQPGPGGISK